MAKKSDLFLRPRRDTAQHFAGVLTEGSEGMGVKRIKKKKKKQTRSFGKEEEGWKRSVNREGAVLLVTHCEHQVRDVLRVTLDERNDD